MGGITDVCRTEATVRRYPQELHGDALYTYQICAVYDRIKAPNVSLVQLHVINESAFSTGKEVAQFNFK